MAARVDNAQARRRDRRCPPSILSPISPLRSQPCFSASASTPPLPPSFSVSTVCLLTFSKRSLRRLLLAVQAPRRRSRGHHDPARDAARPGQRRLLVVTFGVRLRMPSENRGRQRGHGRRQRREPGLANVAGVNEKNKEMSAIVAAGKDTHDGVFARRGRTACADTEVGSTAAAHGGKAAGCGNT